MKNMILKYEKNVKKTHDKNNNKHDYMNKNKNKMNKTIYL